MPRTHTSNHASDHQPFSLNDRLNKNLLAYMATASAAGVSLLAITQSAEAKVVYTPAHRPITVGSRLDLNGDGIPDFTFRSNLYICGTCGYFQVLAPKPNKFMSGGQPLAAGVSVGPSAEFHGGREIMVDWCSCSGNPSTGGPWLGIQNEYMGFQFNIKGQLHFGWARFSVTDKGGITLTGYAYETVALKPIMTGDTGGNDASVDQQGSVVAPELPPAGLGELALGVIGKSRQ